MTPYWTERQELFKTVHQPKHALKPDSGFKTPLLYCQFFLYIIVFSTNVHTTHTHTDEKNPITFLTTQAAPLSCRGQGITKQREVSAPYL